jgi:rSAM/selenodomain-associated transferase 2/rSAM/selenodomain-associated transferase 1
MPGGAADRGRLSIAGCVMQAEHKSSSSLSIVVPVLNESAGILAALQALEPARSRGAEIVVVDGGSQDGTADLARGSGLADIVLQTPRGRALQMNAGASAARGEVLLFLHADTRLPADADRLVLDAIGQRSTQHAWGRFDVHIDGEHPMLAVIAWSMNVRSRLTGIATGDQAMFMRRSAFNSVGGFPPIALMEDISMSSRLKRLSTPACLRAQVRTSGRRWEARGVLRTMFGMWWLRLRYFFGVEPARLAASYDDVRDVRDSAAPGHGRGKGNRFGDTLIEHSAGPSGLARKVCTIQIFAKAPVAGEVKTRLIPALGAEGAAVLHRRLTEVALHAACAAAPGSVELWCAPDASHPALAAMAEQHAVTRHVQAGANLGERMANAMTDALTRSECALLIGSDIAVMNAAVLRDALDRLQDGADVVIVPAEDGGYVLIGLRRAAPELFQDIPWSTPRVMADTRQRAMTANLRLVELPALWDVDNPSDLQRLRRERPELLAGLG